MRRSSMLLGSVLGVWLSLGCSCVTATRVNELVDNSELASLYSSIVRLEGTSTAGTGILLHNRYLLSAAHVCGTYLSMKVMKYKTDAQVVYRDTTNDLCLLKLPVNTEVGEPLRVSTAEDFLFIPSIAVGYPSLLYWMSQPGIIIPEYTSLGNATALTTILNIAPGISGGALLQRNQITGVLEIVGVVVGKTLSARSEGIVVPLPVVKAFLQKAKESGAYNVN